MHKGVTNNGFYLLLASIFWIKFSSSQECKLVLKFPEVESPLFISDTAPQPNDSPVLEPGTKSSFLYPDSVKQGQQLHRKISEGKIVVACPGKGNKLAAKGGNVDNLSCRRGGQVTLDNEEASAEDIACLKRPSARILLTKERCQGERDGVLHLIGFEIDVDWFIPIISVCWDKKKEITLFTQHTVHGKSLPQKVTSPGRPSSFKPGTLYSQKIDSLYTKNAQLKNLGKILGTEASIPGSETYFLARGHLAADGDFVLPAEQDATYFYSNVVPQFQSFNNGNWKAVEEAIRRLAANNKRALTVYSGTMGVLRLKDENGNDVEIHLDPKNKLYPAPFVMWKVVYDSFSAKAVAILGLNAVQEDADLHSEFLNLCNDVCEKLSWARWVSDDWEKGHIICCTWKEFQNLIDLQPHSLGKVTLLND